MTRGHTLFELTAVLLLAAIVTAAVVEPARRQADRAALAGAREALVGVFARARADARRHGGARLHVVPGAGRAWIETAAGAADTLALSEAFAVTLAVPGEPSEVVLVFDALGIGRRASRTFVLARGADTTRLVVAAYGRVERR